MRSRALDRLRSLARGETASVVWFLLSYKVVFFGFMVLSRALFPGLFSLPHYRSTFHFPHSARPGPTTWLATWDAQHYLYLADFGYLRGEPSTAFFPGWPLAIRALAPVTGGSYLAAALILANLLSIAALALLHRYILRPRMAGPAADTALVALLAFPGALFLQFPYSEALFLLLAVGVMAALAHDRWPLAGALSTLLPVVRGVGAFIAVPMLYALWTTYRADRREALRRLPWLAAPVVGVGLYFAFMYTETGAPLSGMQAQRAFLSQRSLLDLVDVVGFARSLADVELAHSYQRSALDRGLFLLFVALLVPLWRRHRDLFFYALPIGLIPAMTSFMSFTRYMLVVFPMFVAAGELLAGSHARHARWLVLGAFVAVQALLAVLHIHFRWAG
jgi:hypothetical protein